VGNVWAYEIRVIVLVETSFTSSPSSPSDDQNVNEGLNLTLFCDATGKPDPNVTWTRVLKNGTDGDIVFLGNPWAIVNIGRTATGTYRCTAHNGIGNPVSHSLCVNVTYPAKIVKLVSEHEVAAQQSVSLDCQAEGNPKPTYTWTPCDPQQSVCQKSVLHFQASDKSVYAFTCKVENNLGSDKRNTFLCVEVLLLPWP